MKKITVLLSVIMLTSYASLAQNVMTAAKKDKKTLTEQEKVLKKEKKADRKQIRKLKGEEVSELSKNAFAIDFPGATEVNWRRDESFDVASFVQGSNYMSAYYDYD